jgi:hypothetical protein
MMANQAILINPLLTAFVVYLIYDWNISMYLIIIMVIDYYPHLN